MCEECPLGLDAFLSSRPSKGTYHNYLSQKYQELFPFVLVDLESLHSDWLTGVVHETMHHAFGP